MVFRDILLFFFLTDNIYPRVISNNWEVFVCLSSIDGQIALYKSTKFDMLVYKNQGIILA